MPLLVAENIRKQFGGLVALKDVSMQVNEGEILGLIGPNGAGKTTFFHILAGYHHPTRGRVTFMGHEIGGTKPSHRVKLGLARTFQVVRPLPSLTVLDNVTIGAFARTNDLEDARNRAREVLEFAGLAHRSGQLAGGLTIADRKRLEVCRALATRPKLLLLDEVFAGLNAAETMQGIELVRKIQATGITLIVVEHVMRVIMSLSDRIAVLHHGEKIAEGPPEEIAQSEQVLTAYLGPRYARA